MKSLYIFKSFNDNKIRVSGYERSVSHLLKLCKSCFDYVFVQLAWLKFPLIFLISVVHDVRQELA